MKREISPLGVVRYFCFLLALIAGYSLLFHFVMLYEGRDYSLLTGVYWTLTTMSTLGFGDVVFQSDLGKAFSILVMLSGVFFLMILLPFLVVRFLYLPWLEVQSSSKVRGRVPDSVSGHVVVVGSDPIAWNLISRLKTAHRPYWLLEPEISKALEFQESGFNVLCGVVDDVKTYERLGVDRSELVVVLTGDIQAANIVFTIREFSPSVKIVANLDHEDSLDLISLAGADQVFQFSEQLGRVLARRVLGLGGKFVVVERFGDLVLVELPVRYSGLVGSSLKEGMFRVKTGLTVVGVWLDGEFKLPSASEVFSGEEVLLVVGEEKSMALFSTSVFEEAGESKSGHVLILGGGRVGLAVARELSVQGVDFRIVDKGVLPKEYASNLVRGSAADRDVLEEAGLFEAQSVVVTTHTDDLNVYLTIYCRKLAPHVRIVGRATRERNVKSMYRAGANVVMSYASLGAMVVYNFLTRQRSFLVSEGLCFRVVDVPISLVGLSLGNSPVFKDCGVSVVGVDRAGVVLSSPPASWVWEGGDKILVVGTVIGQDLLSEQFI